MNPDVVGGGVPATSGFISSKSEVFGTATDTFYPNTQTVVANYQTASLGQPMSRSIFGYVSAKVLGNGVASGFQGYYVRPNGTIVNMALRTATATPLNDLEWQIFQADTQLHLGFTSASAGAFSVKRASLHNKVSPIAP